MASKCSIGSKKKKKQVSYCRIKHKDGFVSIFTYAGQPKGDTNGCSVIALAVTVGITYKQANEILKGFGRKYRDVTHDWSGFMLRGPFRWRGKNENQKLKNFCKKHPRGRYMVMFRNRNESTCHLASVIDGVFYDSGSETSNSMVQLSFKYEGLRI
jgi:hypothetical protein